MTLTDYFLLGLITWLVVLLVGEILFRRAVRKWASADAEKPPVRRWVSEASVNPEGYINPRRDQ